MGLASVILGLISAAELSVTLLRDSLVSVTTALGVSLEVALANTPTVGRLASTTPIASYPTSGPRSDQNID